MRNFRARALLCFSLSCATLASVTSSFAAPPTRASDEDTTVAIARERFKEGVSYFDQKQYDKARVAFLQAYALKKHPAVLLNLAQSELRSSHEADAAKHFSAYLRESTTASDAERQAAETGLNATKSAVALLDVNVDEGGAEIYVDGSPEGVSPLPGPLYVVPGTHTVEARKGGKTKTQQINANAGRQYSADLNFAPKPTPAEIPIVSPSPKENKPALEEAPAPEPAPPEPSSGRKPFFKWLGSSPVGILGVGLTGVGLGGGIGLAIASKKSYDNADSVASQITTTAAKDSGTANPDTSQLCVSPSAWLMKMNYPSNVMPDIATRSSQYSAACSKYQDNVSNGDKLKTWSTVGFIVGGAAAVGTVLYYFVDPNAQESSPDARHERRRIAIVPSIGPAQTGLTVVGSF